ncbi:MAG: hypothetical protein IPJ51_02110 [Saprospiraceae bacterium]|nr:hypothetical protein [Saprospiraceae bacterium]
MKNRILILAGILMMTGHVFGQLVQEDLQWLIRDNKGKDGVRPTSAFYNKFNTTDVPLNFQVKGISSAVAGADLDGNWVNKENEYFAIFENGDYSFTSLSEVNPIFKTDYPIRYLYLTNKYEGDDLPGSVKVLNLSGSSGINNLYENINPDRNYTHDIVAGKDITFIFKNPTSGTKLCYTNPSSGSVTFTKSGFEANNLLNVLKYDSSSPTYLQKEFDSNKCLDLPQANGNIFLNFRPEYGPDVVNKSITFEIIDVVSGTTLKTYDPINISGKFHDPNFVELKCVWEENKKKYAKYHVECYNDGIMQINKLKMALFLPNLAKYNTVSITDWNAGVNPGCGIGKYFKKTIVGPILSVEFIPQNGKVLSGLSLGDTPHEEQIAWFEFCVELKPQTNIYTSDLRPNFPSTTFTNNSSFGDATVLYPIDTYIDKTHCEINTQLPSTVSINGENCTYIRLNTTKCGSCKCVPK